MIKSLKSNCERVRTESPQHFRYEKKKLEELLYRQTFQIPVENCP